MPGSSDRLARATAQYRAGRLREAERLLRELLAGEPDQPDALFFLGTIASEAGHAAAAEQLLRRALARRPLEPAFHAALGNALARAGRHADALAAFRGALQLDPQLLDLHLSIGSALQALGRHAEALAAHERLLEGKRDHIGAQVGRAQALAALGRREDALAAITGLRAEHPLARDLALDEADLRLGLGEREAALALLHDTARRRGLERGLVARLAGLYARAGAHAAALPLWRRLLDADPRPELRLRHAASLLALKRHAEAERELRLAVAARPADADARSDLGLALLGLDRPEEAAGELGEALRLAPRHWQALHNLGLAHIKRGAYASGVAALEQAHALQPEDLDLLANLGYACCLARDFKRGEALFRQASARNPDHLLVSRYLSHYLLGNARFEEGWRERMHRPLPQRLLERKPEFPQPDWQGEPLAGRALVVWSEQGLGDQIMFCNTVPDLIGLGARLVLECDPRLERLFARSFPGARIAPRGARGREVIAAAAPELQLPMSRVPQFLRRSWEAFPRHQGYLRADAARVAYWRARLEALGPGPKVGISWTGGTARTGRARRSTTLADWLPVLRVPGVRFVSLQYTDCRADLERLRAAEGIDIAHWQEAIDDYDETAALATALDAVASVCTSVIHLAGALGRPTLVLVPWWPAWRYLFEGEAMPWYPSARLIRQEKPQDWGAPIARLAEALRRL